MMDYVQTHFERIEKIGLLATTGTLQSGLFQKAFARSDIESILPAREVQENFVMSAIFGKEGIRAIGPSEKSKHLVLDTCQGLVRQGARAVIAGCTEIPLALRDGDLPIPVIDPVAILAKVAVKKALERSSKKEER